MSILYINKGPVINYGNGGVTKREGGRVKFYLYKKGGQAENV